MFAPPDYSAPENFLRPRFGPWTGFLYLHRQPIMEAVREAAPLLGGALLDVGCGIKPYAPLLQCSQHIGVDVATTPHAGDRIDHTYSGEILPFDDASFDSVLCTEVLEHCANPRGIAMEISRVLRSGGYALLTAPMFIHGHEEPYDFQRFTRHGMCELARIAGSDVVWIQPRGGVLSTALAAVYTAVSSSISRRPFIDACLWILWPIAFITVLLERRLDRPVVSSLGWQMLVRKRGPGADRVSDTPHPQEALQGRALGDRGEQHQLSRKADATHFPPDSPF